MEERITQAVILAGGRGTRLGFLTQDTPKPLLPVCGRPFLFYVIEHLHRNGILDIVLSTGYLAEAFERVLGDGSKLGVRIGYAREDTPLGTGGGLCNAARMLPSRDKPFAACNGDTVLDVSLTELAVRVDVSGAKAGVALRRVENSSRFGGVVLDERCMISSFAEKCIAGAGYCNAGFYVFTTAALCYFPPGASSLEQDVFPPLTRERALAGFPVDGFFLDMGLPETYAAAQVLLSQRHVPER